ncbi:MAG: CPBP family intramembrane metalloprotease, partial [Deltaproteobacteria bacterium]|nr:CPBP family intramembrane metalloprotease [Deltaproteobacteria bacterium]
FYHGVAREIKAADEPDKIVETIMEAAEQYKGNAAVLEELALVSAAIERNDITLKVLPLIYKTGSPSPVSEILRDIALGASVGDEAGIESIESLKTSEWVKAGLLASYHRANGMNDAAAIYREKLLDGTFSLVTSGALLFLFFVAALIAGVVIAFRFRAQVRKSESAQAPNSENPNFVKGHEILITTILLWFAAFLSLSVLLPPALALIPAMKNQIAAQIFVTYSVTSFAALYIASRAMTRVSPLFNALGWGGFQSGAFGLLFTALSFYCVSLIPIFAVSALSQSVFDTETLIDNPVIPLLIRSDDSESRIIIFLNIAIAAPFFEELFFRGYVYSKMKEFMDARKSALASGAIFAAAHLSLVNILPLTVLGYFLARSYEKGGHILAPMLYHSVWNSVSYFVILLVFSS